MNSSDNPLIRAHTPFDKRTQALISSGKPRPVGGTFKTLPGGTCFDAGGGKAAPASLRPLHVTRTGIVIPGRICGAMPVIDVTPIDDSPAPALELSGEGTEYVIATVVAVATVSVLDGNSMTLPALTGVTVTLSVTTTLPTADNLVSTPSGGYVTFIVHLATFVDGVKTAQNGWGPIGGYLQDLYTGTGACLLVLLYPGES